MTPTPYGFRVMGGPDNARHPVDYGKAFAAYCQADPAARPEVPAYLSAFTFPIEFCRHLGATGSTRDYRGPVGVPSIKWDIDRACLDVSTLSETPYVFNAHSIDAALHDTRRLASFLVDHYLLDDDDLLIGFSGLKGCHVELPVGGMVEPSPAANVVCRLFAQHVADEIGVVIDTGVYDKVRPFRAWNSRHPKTGLHKIRVGLDALLVSTAESIVRRAVEPVPFDPPVPAPSPSLASDWEKAARTVRRQVEKRRERRAGPADLGVNALTRQLIVEPAAVEVGDRHRRLFSAAANLAEFESADDLILAVLTEPGFDIGLPPREVERQIRTGIAHARGQRGEGGAA
jgi:hypothetical protein